MPSRQSLGNRENPSDASTPRGIKPHEAALGTLIVAIGAVLLLGNLELPLSDGVVLAVLILPLLVWGVASGRFKELRAPGGWVAVLSAAGSARLQPSDWRAIEPISPNDVEGMSDADAKAISRGARPAALHVTIGKERENDGICHVVDRLFEKLHGGMFKYLVFLDRAGRFEGLIPIADVLSTYTLLQHPECPALALAEMLVRDMDDPRVQRDLYSLPGWVGADNAATIGWSRRECLEHMYQLNGEVLPVLDGNRMAGIIERERLLAAMMVEVAAKV